MMTRFSAKLNVDLGGLRHPDGGDIAKKGKRVGKDSGNVRNKIAYA